MAIVASDIIRRAYREGNITPIGVDPTEPEQTEGLETLNSLIRSLYGSSAGVALTDWPAPDNQFTTPFPTDFPQIAPDQLLTSDNVAFQAPTDVWPYPPCNQRIVLGTGAGTVYFPQAPNDGARMAIVNGNLAYPETVVLDGNGHTIDSEATLTVTGAVEPQEWFYRADLGDWQTVAPLVLDEDTDDESPFPDQFDDLLIIGLAIRLAPRHGKSISAESAAVHGSLMRAFESRYCQPTKTVAGGADLVPGLQSYQGGAWGQ